MTQYTYAANAQGHVRLSIGPTPAPSPEWEVKREETYDEDGERQ